MADKKISALTAATTPLAGTEVLPIVQGGNTVKVSVANLTAGRSIEAFAGIIGGADSSTTFAIKGATKAVRFETASTGVSLTGVDSTLVSSYQPLTIQGSAIPISIAGVTVGEFNASGNYAPVAGKGIDFSANTGLPGATSELLDWYEEGTWAIADTSGAGLTLTVDHAKYTRVGNLVTVNAYVTYPVTADASANQLSLPYTAAKYDIGTAGASTGNVYSAITIGGGAQMSVRNLSLQPLLNSNLSGADVLISFTYMV